MFLFNQAKCGSQHEFALKEMDRCFDFKIKESIFFFVSDKINFS